MAVLGKLHPLLFSVKTSFDNIFYIFRGDCLLEIKD